MTTDGMKMKLMDAYLDLKAGTMTTDRKIKFTSESADISSGSLEIFGSGDLIVFDTNVRLTIHPAKKDANKKKNQP